MQPLGSISEYVNVGEQRDELLQAMKQSEADLLVVELLYPQAGTDPLAWVTTARIRLSDAIRKAESLEK